MFCVDQMLPEEIIKNIIKVMNLNLNLKSYVVPNATRKKILKNIIKVINLY